MLSDVVLENGGFTLNLWQFFHKGNDDKPWDLGWGEFFHDFHQVFG